MRTVIAALAALSVLACSREKAPPRERVTLAKVEYLGEIESSPPPAEGNVFAVVHLTEDPARTEPRDWRHSVLEDWDGRTYTPKTAGWIHEESESPRWFGRKKTVHPDSIQIVFEIPRTATPRNVTIPQRIDALNALRNPKPENAPKLIRRVEPVYPELIRRTGVIGAVRMEVLVKEDGRVGGVKVIRDLARVGEYVAPAVRQWEYKPAVDSDGNAVSALIEVTINFDFHE